MKNHKNNPIVSVVIPTYNRAEFITRSVKSALKQTIKNIEVIVVDDGSTDNTNQVISNINDERLRFIKLFENKGAPAARNIGLKNSKGQYICFLDSDDEILPSKLEKQLEVFNNLKEKKSIVYCGFYYIYSKTNEAVKEFIPKEKGDIYNKIIENNCVGSPTPLIHRECFEKSGLFDESLESCQDWDMWIRLSKHFKFEFIPDCLAKVYIHGNQISTNLKTKIAAREKILQKYRNDIILNKSTFSWHLRRLGSYMYIDGQELNGRKIILKSIKVDPINWRGYAHVILSYLSKNLYKELIIKYTLTKTGDIQLYS